jgi:hypothetical protein
MTTAETQAGVLAELAGARESGIRMHFPDGTTP